MSARLPSFPLRPPVQIASSPPPLNRPFKATEGRERYSLASPFPKLALALAPLWENEFLLDTFFLISWFFLIIGVSLIWIGTVESPAETSARCPWEVEGLGGAGREKGLEEEEEEDLGLGGAKLRISKAGPACYKRKKEERH